MHASGPGAFANSSRREGSLRDNGTFYLAFIAAIHKAWVCTPRATEGLPSLPETWFLLFAIKTTGQSIVPKTKQNKVFPVSRKSLERSSCLRNLERPEFQTLPIVKRMT